MSWCEESPPERLEHVLFLTEGTANYANHFLISFDPSVDIPSTTQPESTRNYRDNISTLCASPAASASIHEDSHDMNQTRGKSNYVHHRANTHPA